MTHGQSFVAGLGEETEDMAMERAEEQEREAGRRQALDDLLPEAFAVVREASKRSLGMRHFDVQLIGGIVLHQGRIAEMKTGEGKTLVATLALYLNALEGRGAHLVTVNDYLARRDAGWNASLYHFLGMSVGVIAGQDLSFIYDPEFVDDTHPDPRLQHLRPCTRREAYAADITYSTNNELGFDYLRDNMAQKLDRCVQRRLRYAIVDEVDSILIDEARTPLIISGQASEATDKFYTYARLIPPLVAEDDYTIDEKTQVGDAHRGGRRLRSRSWTGISNVYEMEHAAEAHQINQALQAHTRCCSRDRDYIVPRRRGDHRRRVHRAAHAGTALVGRPPPGDRSQGRRDGPARDRHPRHDHLPVLLPPLRQACGHDRHRARPRPRSSTRSTSSRWSRSRRTGRWCVWTSPT